VGHAARTGDAKRLLPRTGTWQTLDVDVATIDQILQKIPQLGASLPPYQRHFQHSSHASFKPKVFGEVRVTGADTDHLALVYHMIHRHGLGPLIVAERSHIQRQPENAMEFVGLVEGDPHVQEMVRLLHALSPDGLKALHSYDHNPACWHPKRDDECKQGNTRFALQAMRSRGAVQLLARIPCFNCGMGPRLEQEWFPTLHRVLASLGLRQHYEYEWEGKAALLGPLFDDFNFDSQNFFAYIDQGNLLTFKVKPRQAVLDAMGDDARPKSQDGFFTITFDVAPSILERMQTLQGDGASMMAKEIARDLFGKLRGEMSKHRPLFAVCEVAEFYRLALELQRKRLL